MQDLANNALPLGSYAIRILGGLLVTIRISLLSVLFSLILGLLFGLVLCSRHKIIRFIGQLYLEAIRIIPLLVWLFIFYFWIAKVSSLHLNGETASIIVFTLWGTAELGDIVRGAITSIPKHQSESAMALGLTQLQTYTYVIIPQATRRILPAAINLVTRMIKSTSLVVFVGVVEVVKVGQQIIEVASLRSPSAPLWVYGIIFFIYFFMCWPISILARKLETKWKT